MGGTNRPGTSYRIWIGVVLLAVSVSACELLEGTGGRAMVRYQIVARPGDFAVTGNFDPAHCVTTPFDKWIVNKRLNNLGEILDVPSAGLFWGTGFVQPNGNCLFSSLPGLAVPPGQYRLVATDYEWMADCTVSLIAQLPSGQFHNVRFIIGRPSCDEELQPLPSE